MTPIAKAASPWPDGRPQSENEEAILVFVRPGPVQEFEFYHRACFELDHSGQPRMKFTPSQVLDAMKAHVLDPICPECGKSVIRTDTALA